MVFFLVQVFLNRISISDEVEIPFRFKSQILTSFSSPTPKQQLSWIWFIFYLWMSFVCVSRWFSGKASTFQCRRCSKIPGSGRFPEVGNGSPLQYSCWDNPMNKGDYPWTVHGLASYSPWDHKELAMTEQLSTHIVYRKNMNNWTPRPRIGEFQYPGSPLFPVISYSSPTEANCPEFC